MNISNTNDSDEKGVWSRATRPRATPLTPPHPPTLPHSLTKPTSSTNSTPKPHEHHKVEFDYLRVSSDKNLQGLFGSIGFGRERVLFSDHAAFKTLHIETRTYKTRRRNSKEQVIFKLEGLEECAIVVSDQALYCFPPAIPFDGGYHLVCNSYKRLRLSEVLMLSLPYLLKANEEDDDYALRTDDFVVHLLGELTLWFQASQGKRSEVVECLCSAYELLLANEMQLHHPECSELLKSLSDNSIWHWVHAVQDRVWASDPILKQGYLLHQSFENFEDDTRCTSRKWKKLWVVLSVSQIRFFESKKEMDAHRFLLNSPKAKRANIPKINSDSVTLSLYHLYKVTFSPIMNVVHYGFEIANKNTESEPDSTFSTKRPRLKHLQKLRHLFRCSSKEASDEWITAVQMRLASQQRMKRRNRDLL